MQEADWMKFPDLVVGAYARTKAEVWFNSAEAAEAAGFIAGVTNNSEEKDK